MDRYYKKNRCTVYTEKKREIILKNAESCEQFQKMTAAVQAKADKYLGYLDKFYDMIIAEGLPRWYFIGAQRDLERFKCRYCGVDISAEYGLYGWKTDPLNHEWKVQCPGCLRWFPSNDFGGYYRLGLDEHGIFNPELARAKNDALVADGKDGYLKNLLYPEKGDGWGVDDGFGYRTGIIYPNGAVEMHTYIAYYIHEGLWNCADSVNNALYTFRDAYLCTGEIKYGRAGAILLDRIADFYPGYEYFMWHDFRDDLYRGKIKDCIWECFISAEFCLSYDALFPAYEDTEVIEYLRGKSERFKLDNPKNSAAAIRKNIENGILKTVFESAVDKKICGNFGMTQHAVTAAAVVLDTMPETGEWLDWVMAAGEANPSGTCENPPKLRGGNVLAQLTEIVDRDGMGNESSPGYNNLWNTELIGMAELLYNYDKYPSADLYKNPKFMRMFYPQVPLILADYYTAQIADSGGTANAGFCFTARQAVTAFRKTGNPIFAQALYLINGRSVEGLTEGINAEDPKKIQTDVLNVIKEHGELNTGSEMLTGYGFAVLRDGTQGDFWMYFGTADMHGHSDSLNLGIDAYGLNMAPDLGYPEETACQPNRVQWVSATISHNTVTVDEQVQVKYRAGKRGYPLHFDDSGRVKLMDIKQIDTYVQTDEYRRTVVMIKVDDMVSYGIDFFRVTGGNDHIFSFHSQSDQIYETENLSLVPQETGTYADAGVPWGQDPDTDDTKWNPNDLRYPAGYTWLDQVRRADSPGSGFSVDFAVTDFKQVLKDGGNLHLRMTQLNDFELSEVSVVRGRPPAKPSNPKALEYVLARRTGENLDSLFTTVFEPYKDSRYIAKIENVPVKLIKSGNQQHSAVKAVKVTHQNGRADYIVYASDNTAAYRVDDLFDFRGFVGVYIDSSTPYRYVNDGDILFDKINKPGAYTGKVISFTREMSFENAIQISAEQSVDISELPGKYIYVENDGVQNGVYRIEKAKTLEDGSIMLDTGKVSLINGFIDRNDYSKGYTYNISPEQKYRIPLPRE
ncbi:MAG: heparinase II/III-family protein [Oscillospiraceae bacterium]|nr:heparinase II/III-family protein [Oscillospiraceae bacterium]